MHEGCDEKLMVVEDKQGKPEQKLQLVGCLDKTLAVNLPLELTSDHSGGCKDNDNKSRSPGYYRDIFRPPILLNILFGKIKASFSEKKSWSKFPNFGVSKQIDFCETSY